MALPRDYLANERMLLLLLSIDLEEIFILSFFFHLGAEG